MAETRDAEHAGMRMGSFSRDLLKRFMPGNHFPRKFEETGHEEGEDIELSLGLSSNGRFGVDPKRANRLVCSSSMSNLKSSEENTASFAPVATYAPLTRTCSLPTPTETEEEWRKRKELQSLRRLKARRKRLEKLRNVRMMKDKVELEDNYCVGNCQALVAVVNGNGEFSPASRTGSWVSGGHGHGVESKGERASGFGAGGGLEGLPSLQPSPQGSIGSQGSDSSGISEFESRPIPAQGINKYTEVKSPTSVQSLPDQIEQKPVVRSGSINKKPAKFVGAALQNPSTKVTAAEKEAREMLRNVMVDMPCVSTRGDGPNGKSIEGFLYRYRKGEEVRIVCVCHGSFLSPAEFVKHAGGGDVAHPLRHIVVNPSSFL